MAIDVAQLAMTAAAILSPYLVKAGEGLAQKAGEELFDTILRRFARDKDERAESTLRKLRKDPSNVGLQSELVAALTSKILAHPDFSKRLARFVGDLARQGLIQVTAPVPPPTALFQLPADIEDFTGREDQVAALLEGASRARTAPAILIVSGMGGSGKSALAVHAAHLLRERFPDIQLFIDLQGAGSSPVEPIDALASFLRALGIDEGTLSSRDLDEMTKLYRSRLDGKRALILLDNARDEQQIRSLIPGGPGCAVLVTSRSSLSGLAGKTVDIRLPMLEETDALLLLERFVGKSAVAAEPDAARSIVNLCGCLPLAVRIAGGQLKIRGGDLSKYAHDLGSEQERLRMLHLPDLDVRAAFLMSYRNLGPREAALFRLLGLLPGGSFMSEAAAALMDIQSDSMGELLDPLLELQLIEPVGGGRYRFHDLMRLFARERLADEKSASQNAAGLRLAAWYVGESQEMNGWLVVDKHDAKLAGLTDQARPELARSQTLKALAWFEEERPNLLWAVERSHDGKKWQMTWQLAESLSRFYNLRGHWTEWQRTHELALEAARNKHDPLHEAIIRSDLGNVYRLQGHWGLAAAQLEESLSLHRMLDNTLGQSIALDLLGNVYRLQGRWDDALAKFQEALELNRRTKNRVGESIALGGIGNVLRMEGRWEEAVEVYEQSRKMAVERGDERGECITLNNTAWAYAGLGCLTEARIVLQKSLAICDKYHLARGKCIALRTLGEVQVLEGDLESALSSLQESLALARSQRDVRCTCQTLTSLGDAYTRQGRWVAAAECLEEARSTLIRVGDRHGEGLVLRNLGLLREAQERPSEALDLWNAAAERLNSRSPEYADVRRRLEQAVGQPHG